MKQRKIFFTVEALVFKEDDKESVRDFIIEALKGCSGQRKPGVDMKVTRLKLDEDKSKFNYWN
jgi:hypothetical protein